MSNEPLILWGGTDINPNIYNQDKLVWTQPPDNKRDEHELTELDWALFDGRPIIGVCRGAQLICAWAGGQLYQHVTLPSMNYVDVLTSGGHKYKAKVDHHQVMIPPKDAELLAWQYASYEDNVRAYLTNDDWVRLHVIPQVVFFPAYKALAIQPHPEWMLPNDPFVQWINAIAFDLLGVKNAFK